jgi:hypothetical protein
MWKPLALSVLISLAPALVLADTAASQTSPCLASDMHSEATIDRLRRIATDADSESVQLRASLKLPSVPAASVVLVSDSTLCRRAVEAYDSLAVAPAAGRRVYVIQYGSLYAVRDPDPKANVGEWSPIVFFDDAFRYLGGLLSF